MSVPEEAQWPRSTRWPNGLVVSVALLCIALLLVLRHDPHLQIPILALQYGVLFPITWYALASARHSAKHAGGWLPHFTVWVLVVVFAVLASALSWFVTRGQLNPDESAYSFQARIFLAGKLMAEPLPGAAAHVEDTPAEVYYEGHILLPQGWFTKFPPGWPLVLSIARGLRIPWLINPLLGTLLLLLINAIGSVCFSADTGRLAAVMAAFSPFYLVRSVGVMSHMLGAVLAAGACLLLFHAIRRRSLALLGAMLLLCSVNFHVRPWTAFAITAAIGLSAMWLVKSNGRLLVGFTILAAVFALFTILTVGLYNRIYTGSALVSPYALAKGRSSPPELSVSPAEIWSGLRRYGRRAVQDNVFSTFPFVFLLMAFALALEKDKRQEALVLGLIYVALVVAYVFHVRDLGGIFYGERFHFEAFFAAVLLGARDLELMVKRWGVSLRTITFVMISFLAIQISQQAIAAQAVLRDSSVYRQVRHAAEHLDPAIHLVFLHESESLVPKHFNLNQANWRSAPVVYLVDAEVERRSDWACRLGRPQWVVLQYDEAARVVREDPGHAQCK